MRPSIMAGAFSCQKFIKLLSNVCFRCLSELNEKKFREDDQDHFGTGEGHVISIQNII